MDQGSAEARNSGGQCVICGAGDTMCTNVYCTGLRYSLRGYSLRYSLEVERKTNLTQKQPEFIGRLEVTTQRKTIHLDISRRTARNGVCHSTERRPRVMGSWPVGCRGLSDHTPRPPRFMYALVPSPLRPTRPPLHMCAAEKRWLGIPTYLLTEYHTLDGVCLH